jgi:hypothetical protein
MGVSLLVHLGLAGVLVSAVTFLACLFGFRSRVVLLWSGRALALTTGMILVLTWCMLSDSTAASGSRVLWILREAVSSWAP